MRTSKKKTAAPSRAKLGPFNEAELLESAAGFVETLKAGKSHTLRTTTIQLPDPLPLRNGAQVRAVRDRLKLSQTLFAAVLNVPHVTVASWENNQRRPSGAALKLLDIAERHPEIFVGHKKTDRKTVRAATGELAIREVVQAQSALRNFDDEDLYAALGWTVAGQDGVEIGMLHELWTDRPGGSIQFVGVELKSTPATNYVLPVNRVICHEANQLVQMPYAGALIKAGPTALSGRELSDEDEQRILDYYRVPNNRSESSAKPSLRANTKAKRHLAEHRCAHLPLVAEAPAAVRTVPA